MYSRYHQWRYDRLRALRRAAARLAAVLAVARRDPAAADTFGGFSGGRRALPGQPGSRVRAARRSTAGARDRRAEVREGRGRRDRAARRSSRRSCRAARRRRSRRPRRAARSRSRARTRATVVATWNAPRSDRQGHRRRTRARTRIASRSRTRRGALGKEITDVVAFELVKTSRCRTRPAAAAAATQPRQPQHGADADADPKVAKAVADARKATGAKALAAWQARARARRRSTARRSTGSPRCRPPARQPADALATLEALAKSSRGDAIEWLVEARFDPAFAALRADPKFRAAVGLDRKAGDAVRAADGLRRPVGADRDAAATAPRSSSSPSATGRSSCASRPPAAARPCDMPFKGTWRIEGNARSYWRSRRPRARPRARRRGAVPALTAGDEDALHCVARQGPRVHGAADPALSARGVRERPEASRPLIASTALCCTG